MAEAPIQQPQEQTEEEEQVSEEQPSSSGSTEADEDVEDLKEDVQTPPTRPLLSMRSLSIVDPDDDSPNMIVYRKVRQTMLIFFVILSDCSTQQGRKRGGCSLLMINGNDKLSWLVPVYSSCQKCIFMGAPLVGRWCLLSLHY